MSKLQSISLILIILFLSSCSQKLRIKALKAPKILDKSIKNISVSKFRNDYIAQSTQLSALMYTTKINDKAYFNLINRNNLDQILKENEINDSGLVNISNDKSISLEQNEVILRGDVTLSDLSSNHFTQRRLDRNHCIKISKDKKGNKYCSQYREYRVNCRTNTYTVNTEIELIKIISAKVLFIKNYSENSKHSKCYDQNFTLPSKESENTRLAQIIAQNIIKDIAPSYEYFSVVLMDSPDIDYSIKDELLLENALELLKHNRIKKASFLLNNLNNNTKFKSYVSLYNYALTQEALGELSLALKYYKKAEDISLLDEMNEDILKAIIRVENSLKEKSKIAE